MFRRLPFALSLLVSATLLGAPAQILADEPTVVFINGVELGAKPTEIGNQLYFPGDELAKAMGASLSPAGNGGYTLNGLALRTPPMVINGKPFLTLESAAKTLGGSVLRDPVRHMITVTCQAQSPNGIAYYDKNYKTPEQQATAERDQNLKDAGLGSDVYLASKRAELQAMYPKTVAVLDRVPEPTDFKMPAHPWVNPDGADPYTMPDGTPPKQAPAVASVQPNGYLSRMCENGTYKVSISDVKISEALKGISPDLVAPPGSKYVVVTLSEENQTRGQQPTAWFALRDANGTQYVGDYSLSQFSRGALRTRETSTGYIIFQVPSGAQPSALEVLCNPPLSVSLVL